MWQPASGVFMNNDIGDTNPKEAAACIALSKNDSYVMSTSGGKVSLFNMMTFKVMTTFVPPVATFLAFHPQNKYIFAIGMEDSSIQIYNVWNVRVDELLPVNVSLKFKFLSFSSLCPFTKNDLLQFTQIYRVEMFLYSQPRLSAVITLGHRWVGQAKVKSCTSTARKIISFIMIKFTSCAECQLAIYDASKLNRLHYWSLHDSLSAPISSAIYLCDSVLVYASFCDGAVGVCDGAVGVFDAESSRPHCRIAPSVYLPSIMDSSNAYPLVVASIHPNQINLLLE
eukprot:PITA_23748